MDLNTEFKNEFIDKYSKEEYKNIEYLILESIDCIEPYNADIDLWEISTQVEKINELQYNYYITLTNKNNNEITLEVESGINNGTILKNYSFEGKKLIPYCRKIEVLKEIKITSRKDFKIPEGMTIEEYKRLPLTLLDIYKKRNYDNYVTGNTIGTKQYKQDFIDDLRRRGLKWECIYEEIECDINLVG